MCVWRAGGARHKAAAGRIGNLVISHPGAQPKPAQPQPVPSPTLPNAARCFLPPNRTHTPHATCLMLRTPVCLPNTHTYSHRLTTRANTTTTATWPTPIAARACRSPPTALTSEWAIQELNRSCACVIHLVHGTRGGGPKERGLKGPGMLGRQDKQEQRVASSTPRGGGHRRRIHECVLPTGMLVIAAARRCRRSPRALCV